MGEVKPRLETTAVRSLAEKYLVFGGRNYQDSLSSICLVLWTGRLWRETAQGTRGVIWGPQAQAFFQEVSGPAHVDPTTHWPGAPRGLS